MFLRKLKNRSGSTSVQIISKAHGKYKVVRTIGSGFTEQEIKKLWYLGKQELERVSAQSKIFISAQDTVVEHAMESLANASIRTVGPELIFGKLYDHIGFGLIQEGLFRHLVIARLAFPLSKLKTVEYLYRYQGVSLEVDTIYRFLDKLNDQLKQEVEQIAFGHTKKILKGKLSIVFYDMTTLYFEASDEDDLRKTGFSKDGKHQNPQIYLGLLVGLEGYAPLPVFDTGTPLSFQSKIFIEPSVLFVE
ncbi:MAG: hypothetical protein AAF693_21095, partial [Bacteroidota bacterium]